MSNKTVSLTYYENLVAYKDGYEKGVRDMWEATQQTCIKKTFISCSKSAACGEVIEKNNNVATCHINNCPIAQKLLKAVK